MRKLLICTFLIFSLLPLFAAGESDAVTTEVNEQYETFSWQPVAKANQYAAFLGLVPGEIQW